MGLKYGPMQEKGRSKVNKRVVVPSMVKGGKGEEKLIVHNVKSTAVTR